MTPERRTYWFLGILLVFSALGRGLVAGFTELGNDEVYYWTYARFPDLSHFDHPGMVGWVIQLFTLNLLLDNEFFIRLAAVVFGTGSTFLIFLIGKEIRNNATGLTAALLFTTSFYGFILSGIFILPDTPQIFFWLLALYFLVVALPDTTLSLRSRQFMLFSGIASGLAILSKYHSVFLPAGAILYILSYNRSWLKAKEFYASLAMICLLALPILFWNLENDFISFTFHEGRIGVTSKGIQIQYFLTEIAGQFFYNNPVNVVIIIISFVALIRGTDFLNLPARRILLFTSVPLILVFTSFSLFRSTLPHWTGPGYTGLILLAAAWLNGPLNRDTPPRFRRWVAILPAMLLMVSLLTVAIGQIRYGWIPLRKMGVDDVTTDIYGQEQLATKIAPQIKWAEENFLIEPGSPLLTFRWFPAANFDYYIGRKINRNVYAIGTLERIHKYHWINKQRGNLPRGSDAWYIALSDDYEDPSGLYGALYELIIPADTIVILRGSDTIRKAFLFRLIDLKEPMVFNPVDSVKTGVKGKMDTLIYFMKQIRSDDRWIKILEKRAAEQGATLEEMVLREAKILRDSSKVLFKK